ncbi:uncharacterized protein V6R79_011614 [Siganus canaliculatus]
MQTKHRCNSAIVEYTVGSSLFLNDFVTKLCSALLQSQDSGSPILIFLIARYSVQGPEGVFGPRVNSRFDRVIRTSYLLFPTHDSDVNPTMGAQSQALNCCCIRAVPELSLCRGVLLSCALDHQKTEGGQLQNKNENSDVKVKRNYTTANDKRPKALTPKKNLKNRGMKRPSVGPRSDINCLNVGGICQSNRYICQGRYLKDKCSGEKTRQCCMPVGAWSILCAGHHNNRVRACDGHGCGAFNSRRGKDLNKAVDLVCDDFGIVNAPFSGSLAGPVSRKDSDGNQYDGIKLFNDVHCVKIFNIRPYRYLGPVAQEEALGYVLPLQDRFSGITSHLKLQMCDSSDPSPFI